MPPRRCRIRNPFNVQRGLVRMSWNKINLYNLAHQSDSRSIRDENANFRRSVFQQRWNAKRSLRAYHSPNISERQFLARHFESVLPLRSQMTHEEKGLVPPIQALMFAELERRVDTVIFRAHLASSIFSARAAVAQGHVLVNGQKCKEPFYRVKDGDIVTVHPNVVPTLNGPKYPRFTTWNTFSSLMPHNPSKLRGSKPSRLITKETDPTAEEGAEEGKAETKVASLDPSTPRIFEARSFMGPHMFVPDYLEINYVISSVTFLRSPLPQPSRVEIPSPFPPAIHQLAFEWYARILRRRRRQRVKDRAIRSPLGVHVPKLAPTDAADSNSSVVVSMPKPRHVPDPYLSDQRTEAQAAPTWRGFPVSQLRSIKLKPKFDRLVRRDMKEARDAWLRKRESAAKWAPISNVSKDRGVKGHAASSGSGNQRQAQGQARGQQRSQQRQGQTGQKQKEKKPVPVAKDVP
ncbi:hypothetical protein BJ742DRAFT_802479 [Cladochytrium replicatum]|nr:hypothetical protein BJ742DRAFT_802479 [Cladochytrium replicatum]